MIEELYEKLGKEIFGYCCSINGGDHELAGDLMQETFLRAIVNSDVLERLTHGQRRAWLYKTARNLFFDKVRRSSSERQKLSFFQTEELDENAFDNVGAEQILLLLPPDVRLLFRMRYIEGYNSSELGEMFNLPPGTVRARLSAAKKFLKLKLLEE